MSGAAIPRAWLEAQVSRCCERLGITLEDARAALASGELYNQTSHYSYVLRMYLDLLDTPDAEATTDEPADDDDNDLRPVQLDDEQSDSSEPVKCGAEESLDEEPVGR